MFLLPFLHWHFDVQLSILALHQLDAIQVVGTLVHAHHKPHVATDVEAEEEKEENSDGAESQVPYLARICAVRPGHCQVGSIHTYGANNDEDSIRYGADHGEVVPEALLLCLFDLLQLSRAADGQSPTAEACNASSIARPLRLQGNEGG